MEHGFLESNLLQTIVMIITVCVTAIIYWNNKRNVESVVCKELEHRMECGIEDSPL